MSKIFFNNNQCEDILYYSGKQILKLYSKKELSPVEFIKISLKRADTVSNMFNPFTEVRIKTALSMARASENRWLKSKPIGIIDGLPVAIKDSDNIKNWYTNIGSKNHINSSPAKDDTPSVAKLRANGAVFLGKTTTPELLWKGVTDSPLTNITRNPWNKNLTPGGSSGGSAVAISTGSTVFATASDGAGSIRIPASFTGICGLKPTPGLIPRPPSLLIGKMSVHGPLARNISDLTLMLDVIATPCNSKTLVTSKERSWQQIIKTDIKNFKVAIGKDLSLIKVDPEITQIIQNAAKLLENLGVIVEEVEPQFEINCLLRTFEKIWCTAMLKSVKPWLGNVQEKQADQDLINCAKKALKFSALDYIEAKLAATTIAQQMLEFHNKYDLLIIPTVAILPFEVGHICPTGQSYKNWYEWAPLTWLFNITKQPALSMPFGFSKSGLPIGGQIIGRPFEEDLILAVGHKLEKLLNLDLKVCANI
jgi:aspartyl-tRNA(Asn)/glutamyl-tRNA(Gln) amidotransferase subunit A